MAIHVSVSIDIQKSKSEVFDFASNLENLPLWAKAGGVKKVVMDGPLEKGAHAELYRVTNFEHVPRTTYLITEALDGNFICLSGREVGLPFIGKMSCKALDENSTRFTNEVTLQARGPLKLMAKSMQPMIEMSMKSDLENLKRVLEGKE